MSNFVPEKTALGIEFGSTRIKAVLIGPEHTPLAQGDYTWENQLHNGIWTYPLEQVWQGLQSAYAALAADVQQKYGCTLTKVGCIGISAMMHGYLAFDANGELLVPFRTWRNTITGAAAEELTAALPASPGMTAIAVPELPASSEQWITHPAVQAHLLLGLPALKRGDPDFFPLIVGNYALGGGGFVSRLMKAVRDQRGLAYSVRSYFQPLAQLGPFEIGLQTKKEQAQDALALTREVLASFLAQGPSKEELLAAKQNLIGSFPLRLDSNSEILGSVAVIGFYGLPLDYLDRYPDNIEKVTLADIKAAFARRVRPAHLVTVIVAGD